jgi:hypothetical protein
MTSSPPRSPSLTPPVSPGRGTYAEVLSRPATPTTQPGSATASPIRSLPELPAVNLARVPIGRPRPVPTVSYALSPSACHPRRRRYPRRHAPELASKGEKPQRARQMLRQALSLTRRHRYSADVPLRVGSSQPTTACGVLQGVWRWVGEQQRRKPWRRWSRTRRVRRPWSMVGRQAPFRNGTNAQSLRPHQLVLIAFAESSHRSRPYSLLLPGSRPVNSRRTSRALEG